MKIPPLYKIANCLFKMMPMFLVECLEESSISSQSVTPFFEILSSNQTYKKDMNKYMYVKVFYILWNKYNKKILHLSFLFVFLSYRSLWVYGWSITRIEKESKILGDLNKYMYTGWTIATTTKKYKTPQFASKV